MKVSHLLDYVDVHDFLTGIPTGVIDSDASTASDITVLNAQGWNGMMLMVHLLRANDSDTSLTVTFQSSATNSDSDLVAGALASDTFTLACTKAGSDSADLWIGDINFSQANVNGSFVRPAFVTLNAADTVTASITGILYRGSQVLDQAQDNTAVRV